MPRLLLAVLLLSLVVGAPDARAEPPYALEDALRWARAGGPAVSPTTIIGTTTRWARAEADSPYPLCVGWNTLVVLGASGEMTCAWTMTTTIALGDQGTYNATFLTDPFGFDGSGPADYWPTAGLIDSIPWLEVARASPGARRGVCTGPLSYGRGLRVTYPPCRVDADCADAGASGTCTTAATDAQLAQSCAFLVCRAVNANTRLTPKVSR